jgi:prepilin signal peptidase PulO-like enzyme (type II secretory pathway)
MEIFLLVLYVGVAIGCAYLIPHIGVKILTYRHLSGAIKGQSSLFLAVLGGGGGWAAYKHFYYSIDNGIALFFLLLLLLIAWIDWKTGYILNELTYGGYLVFICVQAGRSLAHLGDYLLVSLLTFLFLFLLAKFSKGLGLGDAKLMAMCALVIDWPSIILAFWLATISGLLYVSILQLRGTEVHRKLSLPFGPHLALGVYISFIYGERVLHGFF